jgi:hypothetical protein
MRAIVLILRLARCVDPTDPASGCPTMVSQTGRQWQAECERARMEAIARARQARHNLRPVRDRNDLRDGRAVEPRKKGGRAQFSCKDFLAVA